MQVRQYFGNYPIGLWLLTGELKCATGFTMMKRGRVGSHDPTHPGDKSEGESSGCWEVQCGRYSEVHNLISI